MAEEGIGANTTPRSPVSFKVRYKGETVQLDMFYNSYVMDVIRQSSKQFGISDKDARKLIVKAPDGEVLIKAARLFDVIGPFYADCTLDLEEASQS